MNTALNITIGIGPTGARIRAVRYMADQQVAERVMEFSPEQARAMHDPKSIISTEASLLIKELLDLEDPEA